MNYKTGLEDFIGKESLSKTLRNALIPTESTKIHMEEMGVIRGADRKGTESGA